jgi:ATP-binding cassette subfamily B protein
VRKFLLQKTSTLLKLLAGLYSAQKGIIEVHGVRKPEDIRRNVSMVVQNIMLFPASIKDNITCGHPMSDEVIRQACDAAQLSDWIATLPDGIDTFVGERGGKVSGGEAQKIAFARSLYKDAPILIFDEPTAALDPIAEYEFYLHLNDTVGDKMAIYISHRMASCRFCDHIIVFNDGEIVQKGNHESLLRDESGKYFELWNAQAQYYV